MLLLHFLFFCLVLSIDPENIRVDVKWIHGDEDRSRGNPYYSIDIPFGEYDPQIFPPARSGYVPVPLSSSDEILLYGNCFHSTSHAFIEDTWKYRISTNEFALTVGEGQCSTSPFDFPPPGNFSELNTPGARGYYAGLGLANGDVLIIGGQTAARPYNNDYWVYRDSLRTWRYEEIGSWTSDVYSTYVLPYGTYDAGNRIGSIRTQASAKINSNEAVLFAGWGLAGACSNRLNALWKMKLDTYELAFMKGSQGCDSIGFVDVNKRGIFNDSVVPSARTEFTFYQSIFDPNRIFVFGGYGFGFEDSQYGYLSDLYEYNATINAFKYLKGELVINSPSTYHTQFHDFNSPGALRGAYMWEAGHEEWLVVLGGQAPGGPKTTVWMMDLVSSQWVYFFGSENVYYEGPQYHSKHEWVTEESYLRTGSLMNQHPFTISTYNEMGVSRNRILHGKDYTSASSVLSADWEIQIDVCNLPDVCSNNGFCLRYTTDCATCLECECAKGWVGSSICDVPTCDGIPAGDGSVCSGKGVCTAPDLCTCDGNRDARFFCSRCRNEWRNIEGDCNVCPTFWEDNDDYDVMNEFVDRLCPPPIHAAAVDYIQCNITGCSDKTIFIQGGAPYALGTVEDVWLFDYNIQQYARLWSPFISDRPTFYGTINEFHPGHTPGSRYEHVGFSFFENEFVIFGGLGKQAVDLWEYNIAQGMWRYLKRKEPDWTEVYGHLEEYKLNTYHDQNIFGTRYRFSCVKLDETGEALCLGGEGYSWVAQGGGARTGLLNEVFYYRAEFNQFKLMRGYLCNERSVVFDPNDFHRKNQIPGIQGATVFRHTMGNSSDLVYIMGGYGFDINRVSGYLGAIWAYSMQLNQFKLIGGHTTTSHASHVEVGYEHQYSDGHVYGGVTTPFLWEMDSTQFVSFGGYGMLSSGSITRLRDFWMFNSDMEMIKRATDFDDTTGPTYALLHEWTELEDQANARIGSSYAPSRNFVYPTFHTGNKVVSMRTIAGWYYSDTDQWMIHIDMCNPEGIDPCNNHGFCYDYTDECDCLYCDCKDHYYGTFCEINQCFGHLSNEIGVVCSGEGSCVDTDTCVCNGNLDPATACSTCRNHYSGVNCMDCEPPWSLINDCYHNIEISTAMLSPFGGFTVNRGEFEDHDEWTKAGNYPGAVQFPGYCKIGDSQLLIYGGHGYGVSNTGQGMLNNIWLYDRISQEWNWLRGTGTINHMHNYGTPGIVHILNDPGGRQAPSVFDCSESGFFAGFGVSDWGKYSDIWRFDFSTKMWNWTSAGISSQNQLGNYEVFNEYSEDVYPGTRMDMDCISVSLEEAVCFFGYGYGRRGGDQEYHNDVWKFSKSMYQFAWIHGMFNEFSFGYYGHDNFYSDKVIPGGRRHYSHVPIKIGGDGYPTEILLFGGQGFADTASVGYLADFFMYNVSSNLFKFVGGQKGINKWTSYGTLGMIEDFSYPGGRSRPFLYRASENLVVLLGGNGYNHVGSLGRLNDIWVFDHHKSLFAWIGGSKDRGQYSSCGEMFKYSTSNVLGGRYGGIALSVYNGTEEFGYTFDALRFGGYGGGCFSSYQSQKDLNAIHINFCAGVPVCSDHGRCTKYTYDCSCLECECEENWIGEICNLTSCFGVRSDDENVCNRRGVCNSFDNCECISHYDPFKACKYCKNHWDDTMTPNNCSVCPAPFNNENDCGHEENLRLVFRKGDTQNGDFDPMLSWSSDVHPSGRQFAAHTKISDSRMFIFGGEGKDLNGCSGGLDDVWLYDIETNEFAYWKGTVCNAPVQYGVFGNYNSGYNPGSRARHQAVVTDPSGFNVLTIYGDHGGLRTDIFQFRFSDRKWSWVGGSDAINQVSVWSKLGEFDSGNRMGSRQYHSCGTISFGDDDVWCFFGSGYDFNDYSDFLNDYWKLKISVMEWALVGGNFDGDRNVGWYFSEKTVENELNRPGGRRLQTFIHLEDSEIFYFFGGTGFTIDWNSNGKLNDLWSYNTTDDMWVWLGGTKDMNSYGYAGPIGLFTADEYPSGRENSAGWAITDQYLLIFGGYGYKVGVGGLARLADFWMFNLKNHEWTILAGDTGGNVRGDNGVMNEWNINNMIGSRQGSLYTTLRNTSRIMVLFGGYGESENYGYNYCNDLWTFTLDLCMNIPVNESISQCNYRGRCIEFDWNCLCSECICDEGALGTFCDDFECDGLPSSHPAVCNSRGTCVDLNECECDKGNYNPDSFCSSCLNHWETFATNCSYCPPNWDPDQECGSCLNHFEDDNNDCTTCPSQDWQGGDCNDPVCINCVNGNCESPHNCVCDPLSDWQGEQCDVPICSQGCQNGNCTLPHVCSCGPDWQNDVYSNCSEYHCWRVNDCSAQGTCIGPALCDCDLDWDGPQCDTPRCTPNCVHGSCNLAHVCVCDDDNVYSGAICDTPVCPLGCINGNCIAPGDCDCNLGWTGPTCELHQCTNPTCSSHGVCIAAETCQCDPEWEGPGCYVPTCIQGCLHGECVSPNTCTCHNYTEFEGDACDEPVCVNGCDHGSCTAPGLCTCDSGYFGETCESPLCDPQCEVNGYCDAPWSCVCNDYGDWEGVLCDIPVCPNSCSGHGNCDSPGNCNCDSGWDTALNDCSIPECDAQCDAHGTCVAPNSCLCDNIMLWAGDLCQYPTCISPQCSSHGTCTAPGTCTCEDSTWSGLDCATRVCDPVCVNGVCRDDRTCDCDSHNWIGIDCNTPNCNPECQNNAPCSSSTFTCDCSGLSYSGPACEVPLCDPSCVNGECVDVDTCLCSSHQWAGQACDTPVCNPTCSSHGTCLTDFSCSCDSGYTGDDCSEAVCNPSCVYGFCTNPNECTCYSSWKGDLCDEPVCNPSCVYGTCIGPSNCDCDVGWKGNDCSTPQSSSDNDNDDDSTPSDNDNDDDSTKSDDDDDDEQSKTSTTGTGGSVALDVITVLLVVFGVIIIIIILVVLLVCVSARKRKDGHAPDVPIKRDSKTPEFEIELEDFVKRVEKKVDDIELEDFVKRVEKKVDDAIETFQKTPRVAPAISTPPILIPTVVKEKEEKKPEKKEKKKSKKEKKPKKEKKKKGKKKKKKKQKKSPSEEEKTSTLFEKEKVVGSKEEEPVVQSNVPSEEDRIDVTTDVPGRGHVQCYVVFKEAFVQIYARKVWYKDVENMSAKDEGIEIKLAEGKPAVWVKPKDDKFKKALIAKLQEVESSSSGEEEEEEGEGEAGKEKPPSFDGPPVVVGDAKAGKEKPPSFDGPKEEEDGESEEGSIIDDDELIEIALSDEELYD